MTRITKLPTDDDLADKTWYDRAVWGTIREVTPKGLAFLRTDFGQELTFKAVLGAKVGDRFLIENGWYTEENIGEFQKVSAELKARRIKHEFYIAPAHDWLTANFPQEPICLDGRDYIILSEDDLAIGELAFPGERTWFTGDAAAFYCPYVPLTMTSVAAPAAPPVVFQTRYDVKVHIDPNPTAPVILPYKGRS